jgi:hypothetical protein
MLLHGRCADYKFSISAPTRGAKYSRIEEVVDISEIRPERRERFVLPNWFCLDLPLAELLRSPAARVKVVEAPSDPSVSVAVDVGPGLFGGAQPDYVGYRAVLKFLRDDYASGLESFSIYLNANTLLQVATFDVAKARANGWPYGGVRRVFHNGPKPELVIDETIDEFAFGAVDPALCRLSAYGFPEPAARQRDPRRQWSRAALLLIFSAGLIALGLAAMVRRRLRRGA